MSTFNKAQVASLLASSLPSCVQKNQQAQLVDFLELLFRWNQVHNLTAVRDPLEMIDRHIGDSLSLLPFLKGKRIVDVGTGAGLPGIPLSIVRPDLEFVLLDSNAKKLHFVEHVVGSLALKNVEVVRSRAQNYTGLFDCVLSRALGSLKAFVEASGHLCQKNGTLIAMKGPITEAELAALPDRYTIVNIESVSVPNRAVERHLVFIQRGDERVN